jgi:hypothetical protein
MIELKNLNFKLKCINLFGLIITTRRRLEHIYDVKADVITFKVPKKAEEKKKEKME